MPRKFGYLELIHPDYNLMKFIRLLGRWGGKKSEKEKKEKHIAASSIQTQRAHLYGIDKTVLWQSVSAHCHHT